MNVPSPQTVHNGGKGSYLATGLDLLNFSLLWLISTYMPIACH